MIVTVVPSLRSTSGNDPTRPKPYGPSSPARSLSWINRQVTGPAVVGSSQSGSWSSRPRRLGAGRQARSAGLWGHGEHGDPERPGRFSPQRRRDRGETGGSESEGRCGPGAVEPGEGEDTEEAGEVAG